MVQFRVIPLIDTVQLHLERTRKVDRSLSESEAFCLQNKPSKNKNNQFCIMPQPLRCFCQCLLLFIVSTLNETFFLFHLINIACDLTDILHLTLYVK